MGAGEGVGGGGETAEEAKWEEIPGSGAGGVTQHGVMPPFAYESNNNDSTLTCETLPLEFQPPCQTTCARTHALSTLQQSDFHCYKVASCRRLKTGG